MNDNAPPANANIHDVARLAEVSVATVSNVLNESRPVAAATRARVLKAVAALGYTPHAAARSMRGRGSGLIGLIVADITNPFFTSLVHAVERAANDGGYAVLLCNSDEDPAREQQHLQLLRAQRVDGVILAATGHASHERAAALGQLQVPVVLVDRGSAEFGRDAVMLDNRRAGLEAVRHIIGFGHRRIAMLSGPAAVSTAAERLAGYREALLEGGLAYDERWVRDAGYREERAYDAACEMLRARERPTAVFAANDLIAIGLMRAIADLGLRCPEDVSVVSIDDFAWANAFRPRMTTVAQPVAAMGESAVRMLLSRIDRSAAALPPRTEIMAPMLVVRDSCCAPPQRVVAGAMS
ncbi:LacI family DNA-binding transcriptional regulator [Variovorax sp. RA8]|uniref:LacI family DNA-binding transcriptional regulator n=1 Tax=Variovorax sp. (strain JCM 16519 / RA8) TaxID=662548 RepID=UPI001316E722|nr:LacI family DNA-binding transcriptional regulator [Variovorax sp. RA8]VTU31845.1 Degradation activator [Variovorax sp. RA8]